MTEEEITEKLYSKLRSEFTLTMIFAIPLAM